ncbi:MAG: amidohydrolase [Myxococcales bacterium]|nr:amidohydrolase [Myxococcales bacterium]
MTMLLALLLLAPVAGVDQIYPHLDALYIDLHKNPELSSHEEKTAAKMADELRKLGYEVTTGVGGTGVVGVMKNGQGPTVLLRTELDALPIEEKTGLPYASHVTATDPNGKTVPVMHACGHDIHMSSWVGAATLLSQQKDRWRGTIVMVGQPAEETVKGAEGMIKDGLVKRFPRPDYCVAVHDSHDAPAGKVMVTPGYALANVDSVDVTLFGKSGHGAHPEATVDPIVIAAKTVLAWQTLVSREKDPFDPVVLTVGSIHGGTKYNIIPDSVALQITLRTYKPEVRKLMLEGIARIAKAESVAANSPKEPIVKVAESANATYNDPALSRRLLSMLGRELGEQNVSEWHPEMVAEDFSELCKAAGSPGVQLRIGAVEPSRFAQAQKSGEALPSLHSSGFAPDRERTIKTGVEVLTLSALELLAKPMPAR